MERKQSGVVAKKLDSSGMYRKAGRYVHRLLTIFHNRLKIRLFLPKLPFVNQTVVNIVTLNRVLNILMDSTYSLLTIL